MLWDTAVVFFLDALLFTELNAGLCIYYKVSPYIIKWSLHVL